MATPTDHEHLWKEELLYAPGSAIPSSTFFCSVCGITRLDPVERQYTIWVTGDAATNYKRHWGTAQPYSTVTFKAAGPPTGVSIKGMLLHVDDATYEGSLSDDGFYVFEFLMPPHDVIVWTETIPALKE